MCMLLMLLLWLGAALADDEQICVRMCVPQIYYKDCLSLLHDASEAGNNIECVAGRDRIDCLDQVNNRKADVLAAEPEDMYVAYHNKNEDYRVFADIRSKAERNAAFHYENIKLLENNIKKRPWMGYIAHADAVNTDEKLHSLQQSLQQFFEHGQHAENKVAAAHLLINENGVYHSKPQAVEPKQYLQLAGYRELIERNDSAKVKWCVQTDAEAAKCNDIRRAAYSRDIRPEIECTQQQDCIIAVQQNKADFTVVKPQLLKNARDAKLQPVVYEDFPKSDANVAVIEPAMKIEDIQTATITFDNHLGARLSVMYLNKARGWSNYCNPISSAAGQIRIVHSSQLEKYKNKQLLCSNLQKRPITDAPHCNLDFGISPSVVVSQLKSPLERETIRQLFITLSNMFGANGKHEDVYQLFTGNFMDDNVIFDSDGTDLKPIKDGGIIPNEDTFNEFYYCNENIKQ